MSISSNLIAAQQLMLRQAGARLVIDGVLGEKTAAAMAARPELATKLKVVEEIFMSIPLVSDGDWYPLASLMPYLESASTLTGIDIDILIWMMNLESTKRVSSGIVYYNARSRNGSSSGLGQVQPRAWTNAQEWAIGNVRDRFSLQPYESARFNAEQSIHAMAFYSRWTEYVLGRKSGPALPLTKEVRYALYNQGPGFYYRALKNDPMVEGDQSGPAKGVLQVARQQLLSGAAFVS